MKTKNKNDIAHIRMDNEFKNKVNEIAFKNGTNLSELVRSFLKEYVKVDEEHNKES